MAVGQIFLLLKSLICLLTILRWNLTWTILDNFGIFLSQMAALALVVEAIKLDSARNKSRITSMAVRQIFLSLESLVCLYRNLNWNLNLNNSEQFWHFLVQFGGISVGSRSNEAG